VKNKPNVFFLSFFIDFFFVMRESIRAYSKI